MARRDSVCRSAHHSNNVGSARRPRDETPFAQQHRYNDVPHRARNATRSVARAPQDADSPYDGAFFLPTPLQAPHSPHTAILRGLAVPLRLAVSTDCLRVPHSTQDPASSTLQHATPQQHA